jgi:hypothetical protein
MPNAAAKKVNKPSATRWLAGEDEDELDFGALEELVGTGVPVGNAPTPLVIGPLSVVWKSSKVRGEYMEKPVKQGNEPQLVHSSREPSQQTDTRQKYLHCSVRWSRYEKQRRYTRWEK